MSGRLRRPMSPYRTTGMLGLDDKIHPIVISGGAMNEKRNTSPADRFRNIMSAEQNRDEATAAGRRYPKNASSPGFNLPKPGAQNQGQLRSPDGSSNSPSSVAQVS